MTTPSRPDPANRLDRPELAPLVDELIRRYESGQVPVRVTVPALSAEGERILADILGLDGYLGAGGRSGSSRALAIDRLAVALGGDVRLLLEDLRGPLADRKAQRADEAVRRSELWDWLETALADVPAMTEVAARHWIERTRRAGVPNGDVDELRRRLGLAVAVLRRLPADGSTLASLGAEVAGDAHLLDLGGPVGRLVVDALAVIDGRSTPTDGAGIRELWERVGVVVDPLSSSVLVLNLGGAGDSPLAQWMSEAAAVHEPLVVTLSQLSRWGYRPPSDDAVFVVENPAILIDAAASDVDVPMLCTAGWPSVVAVGVIRSLRASGVTVYQHADFDPSGLRITAWLAARLGTVPWEMSGDAYRRALDAVPTSPATVGDVPDSPWDPSLARLMRSERRAIHEESICHDLLRSMTGR